SLGLHLLKEHHKLLGYTRTPAIYDRADSLSAIKKSLKEVGADDIEPRIALAVMSRNKGEGVRAGEFAQSATSPYERQIARAWQRYEQMLREDGAVDFDDLLVHAVELLGRHPEVRQQCLARWRYIHIDEYQDTNRIQAELTNLLVGPEQNICAVGDVDQTIYSWRGAQIANILSFDRTYPGAQVILLEENYRSTQNILRAANDIIAHNRERPEKNLFTKNVEGAALGLYQAFDEADEAGFVTRIVKEKIAEGKRPRDFAVLYRANYQSRALEEAMLAGHVPYQVLGTRFFERKEVKDALSYIRAALYQTPADIQRASETPRRGIGKVALLRLLRNEPAGPKVQQFIGLLGRIAAQKERPPAEIVKFVIVESGMEQLYKDDKFEGPERLGNLRELASLAARYSDIEDFLGAVALASEQDELKEEKDAVRLMTIHAAKGLEFDTVFITGLEEGLFPMSRENSDSDKEEERRLMYVALTRAQKKLYLTYASYRTVFGQKNPTLPSQFLSDLPSDLLELEMPERLGKTIYLD
ncbi:MAG: 3'-5' exonuclease, partial [Patescibacteria group bacterium]